MSNNLSVYQSFIHISRYARFLPSEQRRETWTETVARYFDFFQVHLKERCDFNISKELRYELEQAVLNMEVMPSMRCMMASGPALARDEVAGYNPVSGDTKVLTKEYGLVEIQKLSGQTATVLNVNGEWTDGTFNSYGKQDIWEVTVKLNSNTEKVIKCSGNHRWVLEDGTVLSTEQLVAGQHLPFRAPARPDVNNIDYRLGVIHGLVYGDGTATYSCERLKGYHIRLCSDAEELLEYFYDYPVTYPKSANGDPVVMLYDGFAKTHALKELPSGNETDSYLVGFIRGWMAADGSVSKGARTSICCSQDGVDWLTNIAPKVGIYVQRTQQLPSETNYGKRKKDSFSVYLSRSSLIAEDFLISRKRERFKSLESRFVVSSVQKTNLQEEVFCAEVPDTNTFCLELGLITGNCSFVAIDNQKTFGEVLYILMCGTGVGFSVERQFVQKLPEVPDVLYPSDTVIVVPDSRVGWAKCFNELLSLLYAGVVPNWDLSKLRPAGAVLKTFGGRSSGPEPLDRLFKFVVSVFQNAKGRKLTSLECHDIVCMTGEIVVVGGVRRSALISLSNLSDDRMRSAKTGQWWMTTPYRSLANNSAVYNDKQPTMETFMTEWKSLYDSKSGERGIFSRYASKAVIERSNAFRTAHFGDIRTREIDYEFGTNPCCVTGDTPILTDRGYYPIISLVGQKINIWNGECFAEVVPYVAGRSQVWRVTLSDGTHLDCTPNHRWINKNGDFVTTKEMTTGMAIAKFSMPIIDGGTDAQVDAYSQGFYSADGCSDMTTSYVYQPKYAVISRLCGEVKEQSEKTERRRWRHGMMLAKNFVPMNNSINYRLDWLAGLIDGDGTKVYSDNTKTSYSIQIASINLSFLKDVRLMLTTLGVQAKIGVMRHEGTGIGGYECQTCYRLCINTYDVLALKNLGLNTNRIVLDDFEINRDARRFVTVESIELLSSEEETYCFTEPKTSRGTFNGIVTGNSEIILRDKQFCNLSESIVRHYDTLEDLKRKIRIATILGTFQSTLTEFRFLSKKWGNNTEDERLLGVSLTGIMDNYVMSGQAGIDSLKHWLTELRKEAIRTNIEFAGLLGIPVSTAITAVKPSGTVSQLTDSASGIHPRHHPHYIRTVRADKKDPLAKMMIDMGFPHEDDLMRPDHNYVFSFPMKSPSNALYRHDLDAIKQLEVWLAYQLYYTEHKPSVTISVREEEWMKVGAWVYDNFEYLAGVSFLPLSEHSYQQAPYQDIEEEKYLELMEHMPKEVDWSKLQEYETTDQTTSSQELACVAGGCEI